MQRLSQALRNFIFIHCNAYIICIDYQDLLAAKRSLFLFVDDDSLVFDYEI
jgi:hypothetical protein